MNELGVRRPREGHAPAGRAGAPETHGGLRVRGLVVRYPGPGGAEPTTAVAGVDLDVAVGEVVALLGPSGSGKSSLLRAVAGLEPVAAGSVSWAGRDLAGVPVHERGFGLMFQDGQLFPHRSVAGNVAYGLAVARVARAERRRRVAELLELVGLAGYGPRPVSTLSGGQAQRVALARALAPAPTLLLLDEPLSALDRGLRERLTGELHDILRATGTTALYVTHDHDEAFTVADRVGVMDRGRLLQVDAPARLWQAPASRDVAAFLGYGPFLPARVTGRVARTAIGEAPLPAGAAAEGDALLGLGPTALHVDEEDPAGVLAPVVATRFRRGRTEVDVVLPDGQRATALAGVSLPDGDRVRLRLDPAGVVVLPHGTRHAAGRSHLPR
ncbi:ABC transporter ATP-binding protein [Georgenia sp. AZ-5]|uniref:ABC transporter ATP-binding protein n=1 Tax=Georgenia sp. AZ-5 TaxID=3367526 RepID=UPI00375464D1